MPRLTRGFVVWVSLLTASVPLAGARTWTDATGRFQVEAELVEIKEGKAQLKTAGGSVIAVPLERLSSADGEYVSQWMSLRKQYPWLDTDAPFDVVAFLAPLPDPENAAVLYPDALPASFLTAPSCCQLFSTP